MRYDVITAEPYKWNSLSVLRPHMPLNVLKHIGNTEHIADSISSRAERSTLCQHSGSFRTAEQRLLHRTHTCRRVSKLYDAISMHVDMVLSI